MFGCLAVLLMGIKTSLDDKNKGFIILELPYHIAMV
jgi:hypothetical protein